MDDLISNNVINNIDNILESIKQIIINADRWIEVFEISELLGVTRHHHFIPGDNNSTIAHLINKKLKKHGFKSKKVHYENDYSIWVASPLVSEDDFPPDGYEKSDFLNKPCKFKKVSTSEELNLKYLNKQELLEKNKYTKTSLSSLSKEQSLKILEIAGDNECSYDDKIAVLETTFGELPDIHTNLSEIGKYGPLNQYVLEAYMTLKGFTSRKWQSTNHKLKNMDIKQNAEPIYFELNKADKVISYCLYNEDQLIHKIDNESENENKIEETEAIKFIKIEEAFELIENVINSANTMIVSANYIAEKLNISLKENLVENKEESLPLRNILYLLAQRKGYYYKKLEQTAFISKVPFDNMGSNKTKIKELKSSSPKAKQNMAEITEIIKEFIRDFNGIFGKIAITKLLTGSNDLLENIHNDKVINSKYYGKISPKKFTIVMKIIEKLIRENEIIQTGSLLYLSEPAKTPKSKPKEDNKYLNEIINLINHQENVFVTGYAGTGKSYILNKLKMKYKKDLTVTSTTGLAAVNVQGQTIHSWTGVGICNQPINKTVEKILEKSVLKKRILNCKIIAIDEISMLDARTLDYIDNVLKIIREDESPFGGIQVLLFGDFFQLPPVDKNGNIVFCFESECWNALSLKTVFLNKIYRQKDENFIKALSNMRINNLTQEDINLLKTREVTENMENTDILHIFATNEEADRYNNLKFNSINNPIYKFKSKDGIYRGNKFINSGDELGSTEVISLENLKKTCKVPEIVEFKQGCKVMLLINLDFERGLINGSCGTIQAINDDSIVIQFDNGEKEAISKHTFEYNWNDKLAASRDQFPLRLAYGITIHKSQGMTLDKLVVDCNRIFEAGQAYVALSRIKSLDGLFLKSFTESKVFVNEKVVSFYKNLL